MKKLVLTFVALVAVATTSFAQYFTVFQPCQSVAYSAPKVTYNVPTISYDVPNVTFSTPGTVNYNTTSVRGYNRSDGTCVRSHVRTMPNNTNWDNYSTKGNSNPFTGSTGHRARDYSSDAYNYGAGHSIHSGSRGGQYYYNDYGHKTYVPKRNLW